MADENELLLKLKSLKKNVEELQILVLASKDSKFEEVDIKIKPREYYRKHNNKVFLLKKGIYKIPIYLGATVKISTIDGKYYKNEYWGTRYDTCKGLTIEFPINIEENFDFVCNSDYNFNLLKHASMVFGNENHKYPLNKILMTTNRVNLESYNNDIWSSGEINHLFLANDINEYLID